MNRLEHLEELRGEAYVDALRDLAPHLLTVARAAEDFCAAMANAEHDEGQGVEGVHPNIIERLMDAVYPLTQPYEPPPITYKAVLNPSPRRG